MGSIGSWGILAVGLVLIAMGVVAAIVVAAVLALRSRRPGPAPAGEPAGDRARSGEPHGDQGGPGELPRDH